MTAAPAAPAPRRWVVCADDFAIDDGAVEGIIDLIHRGRVTATSALVDSPLWRAAAPALARAADGGAAPRADIGLHLNLTQRFGAPLPECWPLPELALRCALGRIARVRLRWRIEAQFDAFEDALGRRPDYVDGHQHVHQFAVVRDELVDTLRRRYGAQLPWLRSTRPPPSLGSAKARLIALLGERALRARAGAAQIVQNPYLVGVYDFRAGTAGATARYWQLLERWLACGPDGSALMCHPATRAQARDAIGAAREMEHAALAGKRFGAALAAAGIELATGTALYMPAARSSPGPAVGGR